MWETNFSQRREKIRLLSPNSLQHIPVYKQIYFAVFSLENVGYYVEGDNISSVPKDFWR